MSQFYDAQPPMLPLVFSAAFIAFTVVEAEAINTAPAPRSIAPQYSAYDPPTLAPSAIVLNAVPAFRAEQGMVKFFFGPSKTHIAPSADTALKDIVSAIRNGQRVKIAGFHDETGNPQLNTQLAQKRAEVITQKLMDFGAPAKAILLQKPALAAPTSNHAEARRVEVVLLQ